MGRIIPYIVENKKWSKPPTNYEDFQAPVKARIRVSAKNKSPASSKTIWVRMGYNPQRWNTQPRIWVFQQTRSGWGSSRPKIRDCAEGIWGNTCLQIRDHGAKHWMNINIYIYVYIYIIYIHIIILYIYILFTTSHPPRQDKSVTTPVWASSWYNFITLPSQ
jgi:hypothetical protein